MFSLLSPKRAADLLQVSESTVRRWCDRGYLPISRTTGGHRRIALADLVEFARRENLSLGNLPDAKPASVAEISQALFRHIENGDVLGVRRLLADATTRTVPPAVLCDEVIAPTLHRVGEHWERGELDIYQEHAASAAVHGGLLTLHELYPIPLADAPTAICASLARDPSTIGSAMAALVLRSVGYSVVLLGADTPGTEIALAAERYRASLVAVSVGHVEDSDAFIADFSDLSHACEYMRIRLAVGGQGLRRDLRKRMSADLFGSSMQHLVTFARARKGIDAA